MTDNSETAAKPNGDQPPVVEERRSRASQVEPPRHLSAYVDLAGSMIVTAGVVAFFNGLMALKGHSTTGVFDFVVDPDRFTMCAVIIMVFGIVSVLGGIFALRGKNLSFALLGATLGILGGGLVGFWLGLGAILLLFLSSEDF